MANATCPYPCEVACSGTLRCSLREVFDAEAEAEAEARTPTRQLTADGGRVTVGQRLRSMERARELSGFGETCHGRC